MISLLGRYSELLDTILTSSICAWDIAMSIWSKADGVPTCQIRLFIKIAIGVEVSAIIPKT